MTSAGSTQNGSDSGLISPDLSDATPQPQTRDQLRSEMTRLYQQAKDKRILDAYADYAERMTALCREYHRALLQTNFPQAEWVEPGAVMEYDLSMSPKSADIALLRLDAPTHAIKRIVWDWAKMKAYLLT